jgi:hypothetical protein
MPQNSGLPEFCNIKRCKSSKLDLRCQPRARRVEDSGRESLYAYEMLEQPNHVAAAAMISSAVIVVCRPAMSGVVEGAHTSAAMRSRPQAIREELKSGSDSKTER